MTQDDVNKSLLAFVLPLAVGNLFQQLYNIIDTYIVGKVVGSNELAAIGAITSLFFLFNAIVFGIRTGIMVVCSRSYGERDKNQFFNNSIAGSLIITIAIIPCFIVAFFFTENILMLVNIPEEILLTATIYMKIIAIGLPFVFIFNLGNAIFQSMGNSRISFIILVISTLINVALDLLFVCRFHWGVEGAAYATVIAQIISAVIVSGFALLNLKRLKGVKFNISGESLINILQIAVPSIMQQGIISIGAISVSALINTCGTDIIAATTIAGKIEGIVSTPILSISETVSVFTSQNLGARKENRIWLGLKSSLIMCTILSGLLLVAIITCGENIIGIFLDEYNPVIVAEGKKYMFCMWGVIFFMSFGRCGAGVLSGYQKMKSVVISYFVNIFSRVLIAYSFFGIFGKYAVYVASPLSVLIGAIVSGVYIYYYFFRNRIKEKFRYVNIFRLIIHSSSETDII